MIRLIALFIIGAAGAAAQTAKTETASEDRWEYCVMETRLADWKSPGYVGTVKIGGADQGCKDESVTASGEQKGQVYSEGEAAGVEQQAVSKALAQLGKDRWELVTVSQRGVDGHRAFERTFYFKRRVR